jgi:hypothetical protein
MIESMAALSFHLFVFTSACLALRTCCQVPTAKLSTVWTNQLSQSRIDSAFHQVAVLARHLLFPDDNSGPLFFCAGFYCVSPCTTATFGVYTNPSWPLPLDEAYATYPDSVLVVWSANHDRAPGPEECDPELSFTGDGDLVLRDADGSFVWSSNTSGRSVVGMNMTESGNLVLFDHENKTVW